MAYNNFKQEVTYPHIVMEQVQIIQKIYSKELRDGDKIMKNNIGEQIIEGEDTRYSFLQAVEFFGSLLYPYFYMPNPEYPGIQIEEFNDYCELLNLELVEALEDDEFQVLVKNVFFLEDKIRPKEVAKVDEKFRHQVNTFFLNYKVKEGRRVFRRLLELFKDNQFLTQEDFTDGADMGMVFDVEKEGPLDFDEDEGGG